MPASPDEPRLLHLFATEGEARILAARLAEIGIDAWVEGGVTASYRAEAPGGARLLVRQRDLDRAIETLAPRRITGLLPPRTPPTTPDPIERSRTRPLRAIVALALAAFVLWGVLRGWW